MPSPTITSFTPTSGDVGINVVITGTNFTGTTGVSFNGTPVTSFTIDSGTQITAIPAPGTTTGTIAVTNGSGTGTSGSSYTVEDVTTGGGSVQSWTTDLIPGPADAISFRDGIFTTKEASASSTLAFAQTIDIARSLSDALTFSDSIVLVHEIHRSLSDAITFTNSTTQALSDVAGSATEEDFIEFINVDSGAGSTVDEAIFFDSLLVSGGSVIDEVATFAIPLSSTITFTDYVAFALEDVIAFTDLAYATRIMFLVASDSIAFTDSIDIFGHYWLSDVITFSDSVTGYIEHHINVSDAVVFMDSYTLQAPYHLVDELTFSDLVSIVHELNLTDSIFFVDTAEHVHVEDVVDPITFTDVVSIVLHAMALEDVIAFADAVASDASEFSRDLEDVIEFSDSVYYAVPRLQKVCEEIFPTDLNFRDHIMLTYPYSGPSLTLNLRNPMFGNEDNNSTLTQFQRTRSGQLKTVRATTWPTIKTQTMSIEGLSEQLRDDFLNFVTESAALEIGLLDQDGRQWRGILVNPVLETQQVGIGCQYTASFTFRGALA